MRYSLKRTGSIVFVIAILTFGATSPLKAASLPLGVWAEFSFTNAGTPASGCFPADPGGNFCIPSFGTPTVFLGAPSWTFSAPLASTLTVTDAFEAGDRFQIFDFGASLGLTSVPSGNADCGDDPVPCLTAAGISKGLFTLGAGAHSISITPTLSSGGGAAYLRVDSAAQQVPEPDSYILIGGSIAALWLVRKRLRPLNQ